MRGRSFGRVGRVGRVGLVGLVGLVGCGSPQSAPSAAQVLIASGPRLPAPAPVDGHVNGGAYLTTIAAQIQPRWSQFLEDCRLRLSKTHPLNTPTLATAVELVIDRDGKLGSGQTMQSSGNGDFDTAVADVLDEVRNLPRPPAELESDDGRVHVRWLFARDRRQAGPATAQVMVLELPLLAVVERMLAARALPRAATRIANAPATDADRPAATERVMIAVTRDGLASLDRNVRRVAIEAVGRARLHGLAGEVHELATSSSDLEIQVAAIGASASLGDAAIVPALLAGLHGELAERPAIALAKVEALVALGQAREVAPVLRAALDKPAWQGAAVAIRALALLPEPALVPKLATAFSRGDPRMRASVCAALPAAAPASASGLVLRGLRDADATVRATCVDAAGRQRKPADRATRQAIMRRLVGLARDRDRTVRARAVAALGVLDPQRRARAADDAAAAVRAAAAIGGSEHELRVLAKDRDPDVRAAALVVLGDRAGDLAIAAVDDPAPQVREAALPALTDDDALLRLAGDDEPAIATAALVRYASRRGRAAITTPFLVQLAAAAPHGTERVRIALAWLLAR